MKKITTKETIALVQNSYNESVNTAESNSLCVPANLEMGFSIGIGRVSIRNGGINSYLVLSDDVNKSYMQDWKKDVGSVFIKDCKKENLSAYYKYFGSNFEALLRRISDDEYDEFKDKGFVHLKLGDYYYMILKVIPLGGTYLKLDSKDEDVTVTPQEPEEEEEYKEEEQEIESLSLF